MDWNRECAAVIPCFNEAAHIRNVVSGVRRHLSKVLVVDDGSTDQTLREAAAAGAEVLRLERNCGKGAALRMGWQKLYDDRFTWVLMLDGDEQHSADDISRFFSAAENSGATLVIGNRMANPGAMPLLRRFVNHWMSRHISKAAGRALPDSQCGFRLARLETLLRFPIVTNRFEIESSTLRAFCSAGEKIEFIPIASIYQDEVSNIRPLVDTWRWLRWAIRSSNTKPAVPLD